MTSDPPIDSLSPRVDDETIAVVFDAADGRAYVPITGEAELQRIVDRQRAELDALAADVARLTAMIDAARDALSR